MLTHQRQTIESVSDLKKSRPALMDTMSSRSHGLGVRLDDSRKAAPAECHLLILTRLWREQVFLVGLLLLFGDLIVYGSVSR